MRTKILRFEQETANTDAIDKDIAKEVHRIENEGFIVFDVQLVIGRDAPANMTDIQKKFSAVALLLYDEPEEEESEE
jgi:hypothetical protein